MISIIFSLLFAFYHPGKAWANARVRKVQVQQDQIVQVRTAIGIATIIQVPERPNSLVVGDQAGFKVEYLDQAITIKPSYSGARSNLYIYTDYRRFNVQLVTTSEANADYVVYLENPKQVTPPSSAIKWKNYRNHLKNDDIFIETRRLAMTKDGVLLLEFEISSNAKEKFRPDWIWLTQNGKTCAIHNLAFSGEFLQKGKSLKAIMQVLKSDIRDNESFRFELRRKKTSYLSLPKVALWK